MTPPEKIPSDARRAYPRPYTPEEPRFFRTKHPWFAGPSCTDTDGGVAESMADLMQQSTIPGKTTAYVPSTGNGITTWKKLQGTDGCKTPTLLLEHSCLASATFAFHYIPCPTGTSCAAATDPATGITAAACVALPPPLPPPPPPAVPCNPLAPGKWQAMDLATNAMPTYVVRQHQASLFAGGVGGVSCWDPDEATWQAINTGFAPPLWNKQPMVVDLASYAGALYGVLINGGEDHLYR